MGANLLAIYSNRSAKSAGVCTTPPFRITVDGKLAVVNDTQANRTFMFPTIALGLGSIYYLTTPILDNQNSTGACGPGCNSVQALEPVAGPPVDATPGIDPNATFYFYDCNITVTSTTAEFSPLKAAIAAQAIALSGQYHPEFINTVQETNQYVSYNFGHPFGEAQNNSATGMASLISRFAMGVISAAAQTNPPKYVPGASPAQGLGLHFGSLLAFNLFLIVTGTVQLLLVVVAAMVVSRTTIPDDVLVCHQEDI